MVSIALAIILSIAVYSALPYLVAIILLLVVGKTIWRAMKKDGDDEES